MRKTKDSGRREHFSTGARRDVGEDKPVPVINHLPVLVDLYYGFSFDRTEPLDTDKSQVDDPDYGMLPDLALNRTQALFERGAKKYGTNNWERGIPLQRIYESMIRHLIQGWAGDTSEDHLAAVIWNAMAVMVTEHRIAIGELPEELGDAGALMYKPKGEENGS
jgi:hypothetical protein